MDELQRDLQRSLGRIEGTLSEVKLHLASLSGKVDGIATNGCAVGREHENRIARLDSAPKTSGAIWGGGVAASIIGLVKLVELLWGGKDVGV